MSSINTLILEAIESLQPYKALNQHLTAANSFYKKAINCHNKGDSIGFMKNYIQHHEHEHGLHSKLAHPTYLTGGKHISARSVASQNHLNTLYSRSEGW